MLSCVVLHSAIKTVMLPCQKGAQLKDNRVSLSDGV